MSTQMFADNPGPTTVNSHWSRLVDEWAAQLAPAEFKVAACLYRLLERNGGEDLRLSAREIAQASGISERLVEDARKVLAAKGIIRLEANPRANWQGFPAAPADQDPAAAWQSALTQGQALDGSAESEEAGIQGLQAPPSGDATADDDFARSAVFAKPAAAEPEAASVVDTTESSCSAIHGEAVSAIISSSAESAELKSARTADATPNPQDKLTAALRQLTGRPPGAEFIKGLLKFVPDYCLLEDCLN